MIDDENRREEQARKAEAKRGELQEAGQRFIRRLFRLGVSLAVAPVNMLPQESRKHFRAAGREFTHGVATLAREFADGLEKMTEEPAKRKSHE
jgi:cytosine/adenosine deaminase-related metal-dependent hydrolase